MNEAIKEIEKRIDELANIEWTKTNKLLIIGQITGLIEAKTIIRNCMNPED